MGSIISKIEQIVISEKNEIRERMLYLQEIRQYTFYTPHVNDFYEYAPLGQLDKVWDKLQTSTLAHKLRSARIPEPEVKAILFDTMCDEFLE